MLKSNTELIESIKNDSPEFRELFNEHIRMEQDLEALLSLKYYPPEVEAKIKEIKKQKLIGKDKMERIAVEYQKRFSSN
ncbi:DUF465 domain-containing protein [Geovibrio thiophilus]|uniref:DUF465 domain-containing protein n=1 Tax=Geovibrio thiophilus TaxID=139438 RepID=A0A410JYQ2_9BACT|nr:DUF465 domain-containing protein [Geovibrio thiophilus]QAR33259.1 DUF465 domain-containing protein [Geovibrio thiophilus]